MNDPAYKIEIHHSSLQGLKAELLRKREEVAQTKLKNEAELPKQHKKKPSKLEKPPKDKKEKVKKSKSNKSNVTELEDFELLRKSRTALEAKTKLYDNLSMPGTSTEFAEEVFLVKFSEKQSETAVNMMKDLERMMMEASTEIISTDEPLVHAEENTADTSDEVEYTDYFGRAVKCLRKELPSYIEKDKKLSKLLNLFPTDKLVVDFNSLKEQYDKSINKSGTGELLSSDMHRELLRQQWEKQEDFLKTKNVIHYQDILFNEARLHGVGYYKFSSDESERSRQHKELNELREETLREQKRRAEERLKQAKEERDHIRNEENRIRAEVGLPPLEDEDDNPSPEEMEAQRQIDQKTKETEELEKMKQAIRDQHIRPWDEGKDGNKLWDQGKTEFKEMSQDEWVTKLRKERKKEFAPPSYFNPDAGAKTFDSTGYFAEPSISTNTFSSSRSNYKFRGNSIQNIQDAISQIQSAETEDLTYDIPLPPSSYPQTIEDKLRELRAQAETTTILERETKAQEKKTFKRKNQILGQPTSIFLPTPIENEVSSDSSENNTEENITNKPNRIIYPNRHNITTDDFSDNSADDDLELERVKSRGAEIPPPLTFDYNCPTRNTKRMKVSKPNLEDAFAAGLEYIKEKNAKKGKNINTQMFDL